MKSTVKHGIMIGRVLTLVSLFVSSGFKIILYICVMEAIECCRVASGARNHDACPNEEWNYCRGTKDARSKLLIFECRGKNEIG
jgi:hypothetical protein